MNILGVTALAIPDVKVVTFGRFRDHRGYFTEVYRQTDFSQHQEMDFIKGARFVQCNESFSRSGTVRGLHFQWNPHMGKLVRTIMGRMVDMALDIRKGSPTLGKIVLYDMPSASDGEFGEWIWVPPGFAHGNYFLGDTVIEYFCTGHHSPGCEAAISPFSADVDWSLADPELKEIFDEIATTTSLITDKDRHGLSVSKWLEDDRAEEFVYESD